ncbi:hypothetical protein [Muricoccus radiodurans]|uniref:hypothetical protein n=1 Tax=Muricoccus radiodurans TaxID=2231721 RepID=UPI003CED1F23
MIGFPHLRRALLAVALGLPGPAALAQQQDCALTVRTHGFLSRAQARCGFTRYAPSMQESARACTRRLSNVSGQEYLRAGSEDFDRNERERGRERLCAELLESFPDMVGR